MIRRCYTNKFPAYIGCTVDEWWFNFQNFAEWYVGHKNYGKDGYHLDKDLTVIGNKVYSPETCDLIPATLNNYVASLNKAVGYHWCNRDKRFIAKIRCVDYRETLGYFTNEEDARNAYLAAKKVQLAALAEKYKHEIREEIYMNLRDWKGQLPTTSMGNAIPMVTLNNK
ncbi:DNA-binding domain protein [Aeromonas phage vB_AceP_PAc]|nr:DNA-binding domain protein [Aeromonas phage vB_AceP_PAc]